MSISARLQKKVTDWLSHEKDTSESTLCDFEQLRYEIRPCDVLLVEGRSRVSEIIKNITQNTWTHSALYIGRLHDIEDPSLREHIRAYYDGEPSEPLLIEALLGKGTVITPLSQYRGIHLRICRPKDLTPADSNKVIAYALQHLGVDYDVRQLLDLARFLIPFGILPRRWRSSLFEYNPGLSTRIVCSTMIAECFGQVHYPILPVVRREEDGSLQFYKRNTRLLLPKDFDLSPYFEIIKYPILGQDDLSVYRQLPWSEEGLVCNDKDDCFIPQGETSTAEEKKG